MDIKNEKGEVLGVIGENKEITPIEGKEKELISMLHKELIQTRDVCIDMEKTLKVAAVLEKSIREGLIK